MQTPNVPGLGPLKYDEEPLAYLGILVDILQEWDRPSSKRYVTIECEAKRISSADVTIKTTEDGRVAISYVCRDGLAADMQDRLRGALDGALVDWNNVVNVSFQNAR